MIYKKSNNLQEETKKTELNTLLKEMKKKGWKVEESEENGHPQLIVNISDVYEVTIEVESIMYYYTFQITDHPDLTEEGITDDPIKEFQTYVKENREAIKEAETQPAEDDERPILKIDTPTVMEPSVKKPT